MTTPIDDDPLAVGLPASGRTHAHVRRVQFADVSPQGRLRLDALARMFQDVSDEDTTDAGFPPDDPWVVRRIDVAVHRFPVLREHVTVTTWGSGIGPRWAERRIRLVSADGEPLVDGAALWVHLDAAGRPAKLTDRFHEVYDEAVSGRRIRARLLHDARPEGLASVPFPLRVTDFDPMGHVNNSVSWAPVEDVLFARRELRAPLRASMEHPGPIDRGTTPEVSWQEVPDGFDLWIDVDGRTASSAQVRSAGSPLSPADAGSPTSE